MVARHSSIRAALPSFLGGVARIFDFGNTLADGPYAPAGESDTDAFAHDWAMLRGDLDLASCGIRRLPSRPSEQPQVVLPAPEPRLPARNRPA
jgi:hypothetical protein